MKRLLLSLTPLLLLAACTDTKGLSAESNRGPNPQSNPNAAVAVTEFADLQCPACAGALPRIVTPLLTEKGQQIRFEYKHFPLSSIHRYALEAAQAAECAADQGRFWEFVDTAFEKQNTLSSQTLRQWAKDLGLDQPLFDRCLKSKVKKDTVLADYAEGREAGVTGTPTFFINGKRVEKNELPEIIKMIDEELATMQQKL